MQTIFKYKQYLLLKTSIFAALIVPQLVVPQLAWTAPSEPDAFFQRLNSSAFEVLPPEPCDADVGSKIPFTSLLASANMGLKRSLQSQAGGKGKDNGKSAEGVDPADLLAEELAAYPINELEFHQRAFLGWVADGRSPAPNKPECSSDLLEREMLARKQHADRIAYSTEFINRCDNYLIRDSGPFWWSLLKLDRQEYNFCNNSRLRKVIISLPNGMHTLAWLALKNDQKPRPLVIGKCGIFCDPGGPTHRFLMEHLFDESPFNVLLIPNGTGPATIRQNKAFEFGGMDEGAEIMHVVDAVMNTALRSRISSVHVLGVSLGANGALFSSLYNAARVRAGWKSPIRSFTALCPVVNLAETFEDVFHESTLVSRTLASVAWDRISEVKDEIPNFRTAVGGYTSTPPTELMPQIMFRLAQFAFPRDPSKWLLAPFHSYSAATEAELRSLNSFVKYAGQTTDPVYIIASANDPLVSPIINSQSLVAAGIANRPNSPIQVSIVPHGSHCAISSTYGWDIGSSLLRAHILAHSPEFDGTSRTLPLSSRQGSAELALKPGESYYEQAWTASMNKSGLDLQVKILDSTRITPVTRTLCLAEETSPDAPADPACLREVRLSFSLQELGIASPAPQNADEVAALTRWANTNLRLSHPSATHLWRLQQTPNQILVKTPFQ